MWIFFSGMGTLVVTGASEHPGGGAAGIWGTGPVGAVWRAVRCHMVPGVCKHVSRKAQEGWTGAEAAVTLRRFGCPHVSTTLRVCFVALLAASGSDHALVGGEHTRPALSATSAAAPAPPRDTWSRG